jgi:hypothetical protein
MASVSRPGPEGLVDSAAGWAEEAAADETADRAGRDEERDHEWEEDRRS